MKETIKRSLLIGIGAVDATRPKVRKVLKEFEKAGAIRHAQAGEILSSVVAAAKKRRKWLERQAEGGASKWKAKANALARRLEARGRKSAKKIIARAQKELR